MQYDYLFNFVQRLDGTIWVGSYSGLVRIQEKAGQFKFEHFKHEQDNPNSLSYNLINALYLENDTKIWACTYDGGLNEIILPQNEEDSIQFIRHQYNPDDPHSIGSNKVNAWLRDNGGVMWLATGDGLDKSAPSNWKFNHVAPEQNNAKSLSHNIVRDFIKDSKGNIWIATNDGLNFLAAENWQQKNFEFKIYRKAKKMPKFIDRRYNELSSNRIHALSEDAHGTLWISTYFAPNFIDLNHLPKLMEVA